MECIVLENLESVSKVGADLLCEEVERKPDASIVVATGESPMGMYAELGCRLARGQLDPSRLRIFQLDEYLDIAEGDSRSLYGWMQRSFLEPLKIAQENVVRLPCDSLDPQRACAQYDRMVEQVGGFDLAVLGLGTNGHLGFNEPPADPASACRLVNLTPESIAGSALYWGTEDRVPRRALTAGMASLLAAKRILLIVTGIHKRQVLKQVLQGPVVPEVPASHLGTCLGVTVLADRNAAGSPGYRLPATLSEVDGVQDAD
ncbi:MAG: glucosamine-6-phosphate deaminase [Chloroflexota bacterium]